MRKRQKLEVLIEYLHEDLLIHVIDMISLRSAFHMMLLSTFLPSDCLGCIPSYRRILLVQ